MIPLAQSITYYTCILQAINNKMHDNTRVESPGLETEA